MDKLHHILGWLLLATLATGALFAFVALNPHVLTQERLPWCATTDPTGETGYLEPIRHPGRAVFMANCIVCHSAVTTEVVVGPSLRDVTLRREEPWIREMIRNGQKLVAQKDPDALAQYEEYDKVMHPDFAYLPEKALDDLVRYLRLEGERSPNHPNNHEQRQ
jgi:mono/diheme cytochrome c family protein